MAHACREWSTRIPLTSQSWIAGCYGPEEAAMDMDAEFVCGVDDASAFEMLW